MRFSPIIANLPATVPFVGPEALERRTGHEILHRIGANESVFGPSPRAISAMQRAASESWQYGDPEQYVLKAALAEHLDLPPECIACGGGIDGLLGLVVRLFLEPGDVVATSLGAYPTFNFHVSAQGARLVMAPYVDDHEDPEALLALAKAEKAKIIYFANPDNPMGTCWPAQTVHRLIDGLSDDMLLVLDEAYVEFAPDDTAPALDVSRPNVLRFRTFSKAHGLAGIRVGYCFGHPATIAGFDKIRNHFGISRISQAGAIAAIQDRNHLAQVKSKVIGARRQIALIAEKNGLKPLPSATNFVAVECGGDGARAKAIVDGLLAFGIFIRTPGVAPLNRCIRISCGTSSDLAALEAALPELLVKLR